MVTRELTNTFLLRSIHQSSNCEAILAISGSTTGDWMLLSGVSTTVLSEDLSEEVGVSNVPGAENGL